VYSLTVHANPDTSYLELNYYNNYSTKNFEVNAFTVPHDAPLVRASLDSSFVASFTTGVVDQDAIFTFNPQLWI